MAFRVVIAGAGVAALETALALRALAEDLVSVELIAPEEEFTESTPGCGGTVPGW